MPYIKGYEREFYEPHAPAPDSPGQLNFQITCLIKQYLDKMGLCYDTINDIVGAIEGAKLEFVRRVVGPYEDTKIQENGDCYGS